MNEATLWGAPLLLPAATGAHVLPAATATRGSARSSAAAAAFPLPCASPAESRHSAAKGRKTEQIGRPLSRFCAPLTQSFRVGFTPWVARRRAMTEARPWTAAACRGVEPRCRSEEGVAVSLVQTPAESRPPQRRLSPTAWRLPGTWGGLAIGTYQPATEQPPRPCPPSQGR